ncbi:transmembrane protein [Anaeramoeba flamelloides]|uniref:Transmembrane protein n=1 Tax=Anaeramoeba flamelloides TaxID=1746091 RepID=A0AAV7Y8W8_9EUKA|nr:transmembrane protein yor223w [Anaeramoeba flamelloides]KAJ6255770.1 transmembrane protein [Anaeramoeba flamelloides]
MTEIDNLTTIEELPVTINVSMTSSRERFKMSIDSSNTVKSLKQKIIRERELPRNSHLRLIHQGQLLEDNQKICDTGIRNEGSLHCVFSQFGNNRNNEGEEEEEERIDIEAIPVGFDRLLMYGFTHFEVEQFRSQFRSSYMRTVEPYPTTETERKEIEDEWVDGLIDLEYMNNDIGVEQQRSIIRRTITEQHQQFSLATSQNGTDYDLFFGAVLGFLLGIVVLFFMWEGLPKKRKLGIILGVVFNICIALLYTIFRTK